MDIFDRDLGPRSREERRTPPFDHVRLDAVGHVQVVLGGEERVIVEAPACLLNEIETVVDEQGTLELRLRPGCPPLPRDARIRFDVTARALRGLGIDGSGTIDAPGIVSDSFGASIDGAGRIAVEAIEARRLHVGIDGAGKFAVDRAKTEETQLSIDGSGTLDVRELESGVLGISVDGMGRVTASGIAETLKIGIDGTGEVDVRNLTARDVEVAVNGIGKVFTRAEQTLDVRVDGYGRIEVSGNPRIRERADGVCCIVRLGESRQAEAESAAE